VTPDLLLDLLAKDNKRGLMPTKGHEVALEIVRRAVESLDDDDAVLHVAEPGSRVWRSGGYWRDILRVSR